MYHAEPPYAKLSGIMPVLARVCAPLRAFAISLVSETFLAEIVSARLQLVKLGWFFLLRLSLLIYLMPTLLY